MTTVAQFTSHTNGSVQDSSLHQRHAEIRALVTTYAPHADRASHLALQVGGAPSSRALEVAVQRWQTTAHHPLAAAPGIDTSRLANADAIDRMVASLQHIQTQLTIAARGLMDAISAHEQTIRIAGAATLAHSTARAALVDEIERQIPAALVQARQDARAALEQAKVACDAATAALNAHTAHVPEDVASWAATRQELAGLVEGHTLRVTQADQASQQADTAYATAHAALWEQRIATARAELAATEQEGTAAIARAKDALAQAETDARYAIATAQASLRNLQAAQQHAT